MKGSTHLTENQLRDYTQGASSRQELLEIGRHLLNCAACRSALPSPPKERFLSIMIGDDEEAENNSICQTSFPLIDSFFASSAFFRRPLISVPAAVILVFGFSVLIWSNAMQTSSSDRTTAHSLNLENLRSDIGSMENLELSPRVPQTADQTRPFSRRSEKVAPGKSGKPAAPERKRSSLANRAARKNGENVSPIRGVALPCTDTQKIKSELLTEQTRIVFRWKKVAQATKYHLYLSDDSEILVDEFESARETEYVLTKPIDLKKNYTWKIIVTLENGDTIVGQSQKINLTDLTQKRAVPKSSKNEETRNRCSKNNGPNE